MNCSNWCFNGAAPARARNAPPSNDGAVASTCFNGAAPARARNVNLHAHVSVPLRASTGPRPRGRGMRLVCLREGVQPAQLQRGRARAGAECTVRIIIGDGNLPASTGPRPRGRGMFPLFQFDSAGPQGFNGAAPARARNEHKTCPATRFCTMLQRGRARAGAECGSHYFWAS